jgi:hypothetical protein
MQGLGELLPSIENTSDSGPQRVKKQSKACWDAVRVA